MINRIFSIVLICLASTCAIAKPRIATSVTPVAAILTMLTGDHADIISINVTSGCPHHYHMRPSDRLKVADSQVLIYIDDKFDVFASKLADKFQGKVIKISDFETINFQDEDRQTNWHFWLDLKNVLALQEELATILLKEFPELEFAIRSNKNKAKAKIASLIQFKKHELEGHDQFVVLNDSLEHFFTGVTGDIIKLYQKDSASLRDFSNLEDALNTSHSQCVVMDASKDRAMYQNFSKKIIQIESENWAVEEGAKEGADLFCDKYLEMINLLKECRSSE